MRTDANKKEQKPDAFWFSLLRLTEKGGIKITKDNFISTYPRMILS